MNARGFHQQQNSNHQCPPPVGLAGEAQFTGLPSSAISALQLRQQAEAKVQVGDCAGAIAILTQLVNQNRANAVDYNNRGLMYFQSGQLEKAMADYDLSIALDPELSQAYNNRGNCHAALGMRVEATLDYDMAIDLNPFNVRALINQGITLRELEIYELAIENFDIALAIGQLEGHVYAERGRTYHLMGEWNAAIADYRRALEILTKSAITAEASRRLHALVEKWMHQLLGSSESSTSERSPL